MKKFKFKTLQSAWEGINEYLYTKEKSIVKNGHGGKWGPEMICYDVFMEIDKPWVDPEFDFGRMFGYRTQKWNSLINNYLDKNYLDLIRDDVVRREKSKSKAYNLVIHFRNTHVSGKDCLISLTLGRRITETKPVLVFHIRTSEVTKRLLLDFLLVQRIAEYIYGENPDVKIELFAPTTYITPENFAMYDILRPIKKLLPKGYKKTDFQKRVLKVLKYFKEIEDPMTIKYKVNRRSALQLQMNDSGMPRSGVFGLLAKNLSITEQGIVYPEDCVTETDRRRYRKQLKK